MVPGDMSEWSWGIFAKKTKFHDAGGPGTVVSPFIRYLAGHWHWTADTWRWDIRLVSRHIIVTIHGPRSAASPLSGAVSTLLIIYTNVWRSTEMYCARMGTIVCCNYSWTIWLSIYIEIHDVQGRIGSETNTVGVNKNWTLVFVNLSAQDASIFQNLCAHH